MDYLTSPILVEQVNKIFIYASQVERNCYSYYFDIDIL